MANEAVPQGAARVVGVLLAAGAGRRMGRPKGTVVGVDGEPWIVRGVRILRAGGCTEVVVVTGAAAEEAERLLTAGPHGTMDASPHVVRAERWSEGMGASLRSGLEAAAALDPDAVAISLVDLPHLETRAIARVLRSPLGESTLRQAHYDGRPGHPVLIGSAHIRPLADALAGDVGARPYLMAHGAEAVDCSDLGGGDDVDSTGTAQTPSPR